jgi:hypothetical protein
MGEQYFSQAAVDGACPKCGGRQFQQPADHKKKGRQIGGWGIPALIGTAMAKADNATKVECVTCGQQFLKG